MAIKHVGKILTDTVVLCVKMGLNIKRPKSGYSLF